VNSGDWRVIYAFMAFFKPLGTWKFPPSVEPESAQVQVRAARAICTVLRARRHCETVAGRLQGMPEVVPCTAVR